MLTSTQSRPHVRSKVTLVDQSKIGTVLDGERFAQDARSLSKESHDFSLGKDTQKFK